MANYYNISIEEMESFLLPQGFSRVSLENTRELVYGKRIDSFGLPITMRIYTGIDPSGESRSLGQDAIRVNVFVKTPNEIKKVFGSKRVHRVSGWKKNLQNRINDIVKKVSQIKLCEKCGLPMVLREGKSKTTGKPYSFYGCVGYPSCTNTKQQ